MATEERRRERPLWLTLVAVVTVVVLVILASAFLPRWWSHRVGDQVDESIARGIGLGLFYGFVFTFLPLGFGWLVFRRLHSLRARVVGVLAAAVLAAPNLLTLSIVLGTGSGAHAGDRTLDVEAPGFRGASLAGALVAAALIAWPLYALRTRGRRRRVRVPA